MAATIGVIVKPSPGTQARTSVANGALALSVRHGDRTRGRPSGGAFVADKHELCAAPDTPAIPAGPSDLFVAGAAKIILIGAAAPEFPR